MGASVAWGCMSVALAFPCAALLGSCAAARSRSFASGDMLARLARPESPAFSAQAPNDARARRRGRRRESRLVACSDTRFDVLTRYAKHAASSPLTPGNEGAATDIRCFGRPAKRRVSKLPAHAPAAQASTHAASASTAITTPLPTACAARPQRPQPASAPPCTAAPRLGGSRRTDRETLCSPAKTPPPARRA